MNDNLWSIVTPSMKLVHKQFHRIIKRAALHILCHNNNSKDKHYWDDKNCSNKLFFHIHMNGQYVGMFQVYFKTDKENFQNACNAIHEVLDAWTNSLKD